MVLVLGVDPGQNGALAVVDSDTGRVVWVDDVPVWYQAVGKKQRKRIDALAVADLFDTYELMGVSLIIMEAVGGRTGQSASAGFVFGYGVGLIYMAGLYSRIPIETVSPMMWKKVMNVPGKAKADDSAIMARADELFPHDRDKFRGPRGGKMIDRAEAAIIGLFGARTVLGRDVIDPREVDTGA